MATSTEAPVEALASAALGITAPFGVHDDVATQLDADLDPSRVRSKQGKSYLAVHDVIRVANRIFGYGRWGYEVTDLTCLGSTTKTKDGGKAGFYVGYRCTIRLTVAGCLPVSGVGYGDGIEYQEQAPVTAHELAVKEAESDALKRAFRNFGDQFGLILYAKDDEKRRIAAEKEADKPAEPTEGDRWATAEELTALVELSERVPGAKEKVADGIAKQRKEHGEHVSAAWLKRQVEALMTKASSIAATETTEKTAAATDAEIAAAFEQDTNKAA